jgi:Ni,Fe-hydrogenase I large subunit
LRKEGRVKDVPFLRSFDQEEVKDMINEVFSQFSNKYTYLAANKNNTLSVAAKQELDGTGIIELARHGSLYIKEKQESSITTHEAPMPSTSADEPQSSSTEDAAELCLSNETRLVVKEATAVIESMKVIRD